MTNMTISNSEQSKTPLTAGSSGSATIQDLGLVGKLTPRDRRLIWIGAATLLVLIAGYSFYSSQKETRLAQGRKALFEAQEILNKELDSVMESMRPKAPAKKDVKAKVEEPFFDERSVKFDVKAKLATGIPALEKVAQSYSGNIVGFEAQMQIANLYYMHGTTPEDAKLAAEWFQKATQTSTESEHTAAALYSLGFAQEALNQCAEAVKTFDRAIHYGETPFRADSLKAQARCFETLKDNASAKKNYEKLAKDYANSEFAKFAQMRLRELK